jgi:hypothetical protein
VVLDARLPPSHPPPDPICLAAPCHWCGSRLLQKQQPRAPSRRRSERTAHTETAGNTADEELAFILNGNTADLEEFKSQGGKLILTNGFADPRSPTLNTVAYYE